VAGPKGLDGSDGDEGEGDEGEGDAAAAEVRMTVEGTPLRMGRVDPEVMARGPTSEAAPLLLHWIVDFREGGGEEDEEVGQVEGEGLGA
jgi:hypothetical protein